MWSAAPAEDDAVPKNIYVPKSLDEELLTVGYQLSCFIDNNLDMSDEDQTSSIMHNWMDKIEYNEDTKSLVEDSTIVTADCTLSDMDTSAGNWECINGFWTILLQNGGWGTPF